MVFSGLASKPVAMVSPGLVSKSVAGFLVELQNQGGEGFSGLGLKIDNYGLVIGALKSVSWFGTQNQAGCGLSVAPQNRWEGIGAVHMSRSSGLLRVEVSRIRVFSLA
jgi:hypothetical protein